MSKKFSFQVFFSDRMLLLGTSLLLTVGLLMVDSSSMVISDRQFGTPFHYLFHQIIFLAGSICIAGIIMQIPIYYWRRWSGYLLLLTFILLILVLLPGIGHTVNGSSRWFHLGFFSLQVSEFTKFFAIIYIASFLLRHQKEVQTKLSGFLKPLLVISLISILLLLEPDFGATTVIFITAIGMIFLAGARLWQFIFLLLLGSGVLAYLAVSSPYRLERLTSFVNPWSNAFDSGYQLTQSLIAFGRGGILGVGLGNSIQKLFYLPEAHTDFLFAVLAEEFGLFGELVVIALFILVISRALYIGRRAFIQENRFSAYLAYGLGIWLALQVIISIGVNCGILPTKGLTLPFMSYGGSSILMSLMVVAVLLRIAYESKSEMMSSREK